VAALRRLRAALGEEVVWCLDARRFEAVWPGFFAQLRSLPTRGDYTAHRGTMDNFPWAWVSCDLHAIAAIAMHLNAHRCEPWEYVWTLDWDVGWHGDLHGIFEAFSSNDADLLTPELPTAHPNASGYKQQPLRNYLADEDVRKALISVSRLSWRLLQRSFASVAAGKHAFCETRAPSLCAQEGAWCVHKSLYELHSELFAPASFSCCNRIEPPRVAELRAAWEELPVEHRPVGQLIHRMHT